MEWASVMREARGPSLKGYSAREEDGVGRKASKYANVNRYMVFKESVLSEPGVIFALIQMKNNRLCK